MNSSAVDTLWQFIGEVAPKNEELLAKRDIEIQQPGITRVYHGVCCNSAAEMLHFQLSHCFKKVRCISNGCQLWGSLFLRHFWGNVIRIGSDHIYLQKLRHRIMILRAYFSRPMLFSNGAWVSCGEVFFKLPPEKSPQLSECFSQGTLP